MNTERSSNTKWPNFWEAEKSGVFDSSDVHNRLYIIDSYIVIDINYKDQIKYFVFVVSQYYISVRYNDIVKYM